MSQLSRLLRCMNPPMPSEKETLTQAAKALEEAEAEIARHHKDFERWEAMADKGAQQVAKISAIDALIERCENYTKGNCFQAGRTADARYGADRACWPCTLHRILHPDNERNET